MSKVSPNNDSLPSFEPIERKPSTKRRRIPSKDTNPADLPSKRPKGKENEGLFIILSHYTFVYKSAEE